MNTGYALSGLAICALLGAPPALAQHVGPGCCSVMEYPELVPPEYWERLARVQEERRAALRESAGESVARRDDLTLIEVPIDPLGADPNTPWLLFQNVNARTEPSTRGGQSTVLTLLSSGSQIEGTYYIVEQSDEEWIEFDYEGDPAYFTRTRATRPHPFNLDAISQFGDLPIGSELINRWWGIPISYEPSDLVEIPEQYTNAVLNRTYLLRQDALDSLIDLIQAAAEDGVGLWVLSPYRSGPAQQTNYLNRLNNPPFLAQRAVAPPGHSEHQLGTTVDFSGVQGGGFIQDGSPQHNWLSEHGIYFGWVQTYTADNIDETGYINEPWHWRWFGDLPLTSASYWVLY